MKCCECGKDITDGGVPLSSDKALCDECAERLENTPEKCPVCGTVERGEEAVALLLTKAPATQQDRLNAKTALVHVCPKCHMLYFDGYQYKLIELLKK